MAKEAKGTKKWNKKGAAGVFIPAAFIGMGIGWLFGYHVAGMFIGLGAGFLAFAILAFVVRE